MICGYTFDDVFFKIVFCDLVPFQDRLRDLKLPKENTLYLLTPDLPLQRDVVSPEK